MNFFLLGLIIVIFAADSSAYDSGDDNFDPSGSCLGNCGGVGSNGMCWCDEYPESCLETGDCCHDFVDYCDADPNAVAGCCTTWTAECYTTASQPTNNFHACKDCGYAIEHCDNVCSSGSMKSGNLADSIACQECCQGYDHEVPWNCPVDSDDEEIPEIECDCSGDLVAQNGDYVCQLQLQVEGFEQDLCQLKKEGEDCAVGAVACAFKEYFTSYFFVVINATSIDKEAWLQDCTETVNWLEVSCIAIEEADFEDTDHVWRVTLEAESEDLTHSAEEYYLEEGTILVDGTNHEVIEEEEDDGNIAIIVTLAMFFTLCIAITLFFCCGNYPDNSVSGDESYSEAEDEYVKSDVFRMPSNRGTRKSTEL